MIIVREVFHAKPGMASKMVKYFQEMMGDGGQGPRNSRIMTDMTGSFNKVIIETEYESMAAFEKEMQDYMKQQGQAPRAPSQHVEMYTKGKREIFRLW